MSLDSSSPIEAFDHKAAKPILSWHTSVIGRLFRSGLAPVMAMLSLEHKDKPDQEWDGLEPLDMLSGWQGSDTRKTR